MSHTEPPHLLPEFSAEGPLYYPAVRGDRDLTARRILLHFILFVLTCLTTTTAGILLPLVLSGNLGIENLHELSLSLLGSPLVIQGVAFAVTLLAILGTHEFGHYFACRYYGVRASLPFFIPFLPVIGIGTLGAFIRIKSPIYSRRALFDIGISGPIAGFVIALPAAVLGLLIANPEITPPPIVFNDPLLFVLIKNVFALPVRVEWNPIWFAAWVGMIATSLNLLPVGQLDGGHIIYALFGKRGHKLIGVGVYLIAIGIAVVAWFYHHWAGGLLYVILLTVMLFAKHPPAGDPYERMGKGRILTAILGLLIFVLSVMPFPMSIY